MTEEQEIDAMIVGAGLGGVCHLKILYDTGYNANVLKSSADHGGVWYWNRYPRARCRFSSSSL
jgi:cyclohexanone monooxygenase